MSHFVILHIHGYILSKLGGQYVTYCIDSQQEIWIALLCKSVLLLSFCTNYGNQIYCTLRSITYSRLGISLNKFKTVSTAINYCASHAVLNE